MRVLLIAIALLAAAPLESAGNDLDLDPYAGKVVLVDFWASWCVPCRRSFPWMNEMHNKYADGGLVILAVNVDREAENAALFLAKYPAEFEVIYDPDASLAKQYEVQVMPSSFIIGRDGVVGKRHEGFKVREQDEYEAALVAALN